MWRKGTSPAWCPDTAKNRRLGGPGYRVSPQPRGGTRLLPTHSPHTSPSLEEGSRRSQRAICIIFFAS